MTYFAIYKTATGELMSDETDDAADRLSDTELTRKGLTRASIAGPFDSGFTWNPATKQRVARAPSADEVARAALVPKAQAGTMTAAEQGQAATLLQRVRF